MTDPAKKAYQDLCDINRRLSGSYVRPEGEKYIDAEDGHVMADSVLVKLLRELGHDDVADEFERVEKWYG